MKDPSLDFAGFAFIKTALASDKSCSANSDCYFLLDSRCISGFCTCDAGLVEEISSEGDKCVPVAVYIREPCKTDPKCSGLGPNSHCIPDGNGQGHCECDANNHFLLGKCWRSIERHNHVELISDKLGDNHLGPKKFHNNWWGLLKEVAYTMHRVGLLVRSDKRHHVVEPTWITLGLRSEYCAGVADFTVTADTLLSAGTELPNPAGNSLPTHCQAIYRTV
uniref:EB domain-containing protein n=1 Tax=Timema genevievae TaxID=629358 RepID=A0A7R9JXL2_TIMGE|nr:unnamed protein product [Timema genevievae]